MLVLSLQLHTYWAFWLGGCLCECPPNVYVILGLGYCCHNFLSCLVLFKSGYCVLLNLMFKFSQLSLILLLKVREITIDGCGMMVYSIGMMSLC